MSCAFEAVDRDGVPIKCSHDRWENHVVDEHPEMQGLQAAVVTTLKDPVFVYQSNRYVRRKIYHRPFVLPQPFHRFYLRVVVVYIGRGQRLRGEVVTAFAATNTRKGDILIWDKYATIQPSSPPA